MLTTTAKVWIGIIVFLVFFWWKAFQIINEVMR